MLQICFTICCSIPKKIPENCSVPISNDSFEWINVKCCKIFQKIPKNGWIDRKCCKFFSENPQKIDDLKENVANYF